MRRIEPFFPRSRGLARVDDRRVISGIIYVIRNGLQWKDAPPGYGSHKTLYNRFFRWSRLGGTCQGSSDAQHRWKAGGGVFTRIFAALAAADGVPERLMIDATHLKTRCTPASLMQKGALAVSAAPRSA